MADYQIIDEAKDLEAILPELLAEPIVAIDTEADSFFHYTEKICLVQVGIPSRPDFAYLIDPLAMGGAASLAPLAPIFSNPEIQILFHAGEYDLYLFKRNCGFEPTNLFDTMISAQVLGYPSVGLAALVKHHFDVSLPKDEQRSDWSLRPLTKTQLSYGATDVYYLVELAELLERELQNAGRMSWAEEEFDTLCKRECPDRGFDELGYLRIKGARRLDPLHLSVLRELFLVRDARARRLDRPPFKIIGARTLLDLAERTPRTDAELRKIKGVGEHTLQRMGKDILGAVAKGLEAPHGPIPKQKSTNPRRRLDRSAEDRLAALKIWRGLRSKELSIDPGVLCPNSALEAIAVENPDSLDEMVDIDELKGWLRNDFGDEILDALDGTRESEA